MRTERTYEVTKAVLWPAWTRIEAREVRSLDSAPDDADLYQRMPTGRLTLEIDDTDLRPGRIFTVTVEIVPGEAIDPPPTPGG